MKLYINNNYFRYYYINQYIYISKFYKNGEYILNYTLSKINKLYFYSL